MKKIKIFMAAASLIGVLSAFATKAEPETVLGYEFISPGNCEADVQVDCIVSNSQTCLITGIDYRRNTSCEFLAKP